MATIIKIPADSIDSFKMTTGPMKIEPRVSLAGWGALPVGLLSSQYLSESLKNQLAQYEQIEFNVIDFEVEE